MVLRTDVQMLRYGSEEPTAVVHLSAIGVFDEERNAAYAKVLLEFIVDRLKIPDTRSVTLGRDWQKGTIKGVVCVIIWNQSDWQEVSWIGFLNVGILGTLKNKEQTSLCKQQFVHKTKPNICKCAFSVAVRTIWNQRPITIKSSEKL